MTESFFIGIKRAAGGWRLLLLLLAANFVFALPLAVPVFLLLSRTTGGTLFAGRMLADKLDAVWLSDVFNEQVRNASAAGTAKTVAVNFLLLGAGYLLLNTFFAGGILAVFAEPERRFTWRDFFAGCGACAGRFLRLLFVSFFFYGAAVVIYALLFWRASEADSRAVAERPGVIRHYALAGLLLLLLAVVSLIFDYARVCTFVNDRRRMAREAFAATGFVARHFLRTFPPYLLLGLGGWALFAGAAWLRNLVGQSSLLTVALAALLGQVALALRLWARMATYAAELHLYQKLAAPVPKESLPPAGESAPVPVIIEPLLKEPAVVAPAVSVLPLPVLPAEPAQTPPASTKVVLEYLPAKPPAEPPAQADERAD